VGTVRGKKILMGLQVFLGQKLLLFLRLASKEDYCGSEAEAPAQG